MRQGYLLIILISWGLNTLIAQNVASTLAYANEQFELENYQNSALAFERAIFFSKDQLEASVYSGLADAHRLNNNLERAIKFYDIAQFVATTNAAKDEIIFRKVFSYLQLTQYDQALIALFDLNDVANPTTQFRKQYLKGVIFYLKEDYDQALSIFENYLSADEKERLAFSEVKRKLIKAEKIKPKLAMWLSVFIPGSGQMLYGNFKDGINSMILSAAIITLYFNYVTDFTLIEGYLVVLPWFMRYYRGGYQNAKAHALEKQALIRSEVYQSLVLLHPELIK